MDQFTQDKLKSMVGKDIKVVDFEKNDVFLIGDEYVLIIEFEGEQFELRGPGGYDGESRFDLDYREESKYA